MLARRILAWGLVSFVVWLICVAGLLYFAGFNENSRTQNLLARANDRTSMEVNLGLIPFSEKVTDDPGEAITIQQLSGELKKQGDDVRVAMTWKHTTNPDDMEAVVDYAPSIGILVYNPEVLGATFRYEGVKPEFLHQMATRHAKSFGDLKKFGCSVVEYDND